jgi:double zinc ribbon protein
MVCPSCGHENRVGRRFCVQCGAGLALACPSCGADAEPGERFCGDGNTSSPIRFECSSGIFTRGAARALSSTGSRAGR